MCWEFVKSESQSQTTVSSCFLSYITVTEATQSVCQDMEGTHRETSFVGSLTSSSASSSSLLNEKIPLGEPWKKKIVFHYNVFFWFFLIPGIPRPCSYDT